MRPLLGVALGLLLSSFALADPPVLLVDSPFDQAGVRQPTRIYSVNLGTGALTLKADLGDTYTPVLGLAAASSTVLYGIGSVNSEDPNEACFSCLLVKIVLQPPSTTASVTPVGRLQTGGVPVAAFTAMSFRADGGLYAISEETEVLYLVDPETAAMMAVGTLSVDPGGGCTTTVLDLTGGDLAFDALDRLWLWNNTPGSKGLWELNPANACALSSASCPNSRNMAGMVVADHTSTSPILRAPSPQDDRLYRVVPGVCPVNGESTSLPLRRNGVAFDHTRGDADSPYCEDDPFCDDDDACTADRCSPGGCLYDTVSCDDGNACTDDSCDPQSGCQTAPHVCDDGDACTADSCDPVTGCQTAPVVCDDGNACTDDSCDPQSGCRTAPHSCDDGNACTADSCDPVTGCQTAPVVCDDGNACTNDSCDPQGGCQTAPHACDDGNACTANSCDPVTGCQTAPFVCDDGNPCTDDSCDPVAGCGFLPNSAGCDDGNPCTEGDACGAGACAGASVHLAEVQGLTVERALGGETVLTWTAQQGVALTYDLVSGSLEDGGLPTAACLDSDLAQPATSDARPDPAEDTGYFYLVRSAGTCGVGPYGKTSSGQDRMPGLDCP